ncbi:MAG: response regulator [Bdellovibrionaceae bacterium]|jgi:DNA-binding NtrC family response regulator|nr:response regulator [Pseudobdellovibrionaceae bacterium]
MNNILIVDDEAGILDILEEFLGDISNNTFRASNGIEALAVLEKEDVKLIISDINMPELDGLGFLGQLKEKNINTPVIIVSGYADKKMLNDAWRLGAYDFIEKPLESANLLEVVSSALLNYDAHMNQRKNMGQKNNTNIITTQLEPTIFENLVKYSKINSLSVDQVINKALGDLFS